jgi:membrane protein DedA with SNARE-associated domain
MPWPSPEYFQSLISAYGYWAVGMIVGLESLGLPLPGETLLVLASLHAGSHHDLHIGAVIAAAATGAIVGDNAGYWLGRQLGYRLLLRYGGYVGLPDRRIKLGQYLFLRHGGKVVFFGRFIPITRILAAFLAGANRMPWRRFLLANAAGGILWATVLGLSAYMFGEAIRQVTGLLTIGLGAVGLIAVVGVVLFLRSHEAQLEIEAERALPAPLRSSSAGQGHPSG